MSAKKNEDWVEAVILDDSDDEGKKTKKYLK
jgi:hypothetical protein